MNGERLIVGNIKGQHNFVPLPYRRVSFQPYNGEMTDVCIKQHLLAREVYRRTDIVILHNKASGFAVAAVQRHASDALFNTVEAVETLALPIDCRFIKDPNVDPANRSALAALAQKHGVNNNQTLIVQGAYDHINIIHCPAPLQLRVVEVTPPEPPKLYKMAEQVLSYADLPPIQLQLECLDIRQLCAQSKAQAYLVPCRSGGLDNLDAPVYFLDERPANRQPWTLIGCERSVQFHQHYYQNTPPRVDMCPRNLASKSNLATIIKCCLLEFDIELSGKTVVVPWGADLAMIERALKQIAKKVDYV